LSEYETVPKSIKPFKVTSVAYLQFDLRCNFCACAFSVRGKNLAQEGKAYIIRSRRKCNATKAIDGRTSSKDNSCLESHYMKRRSWWRVDFERLIELYAVEITPGKLELMQDKTGNVSDIYLNTECR